MGVRDRPVTYVSYSPIYKRKKPGFVLTYLGTDPSTYLRHRDRRSRGLISLMGEPVASRIRASDCCWKQNWLTNDFYNVPLPYWHRGLPTYIEGLKLRMNFQIAVVSIILSRVTTHSTQLRKKNIKHQASHECQFQYRFR